MPRKKSAVLAAVDTTVAMTAVAVMAGIVKWASHGFSSEFLMVVRWGAGLAVFAAYWAGTGRADLRTEKWRSQAWLATAWVLAIFCYYLSLRKVPLMDATLLLNTSALFSPLLAWLLAGQREPWTVWLGILVGFAGVFVVLNPDAGVFQPMALVALASGVLMAFRVYLNSQLSDEPKRVTTFYSLAFGLLVCVVLFAATGFSVAPPNWQAMLFTPAQYVEPWFVDSSLVIAVVALGMLAMLQPLFVAWSLKYGTVGEVAPFRYTGVVVAAGIDWAIWNRLPTRSGLIGFVLIAIGATIILATRRNPQRPLPPSETASANHQNG